MSAQVSAQAEIPKASTEQIAKVAKSAGMALDVITRRYLEIFAEDFIQKDTQFKTPEERHRYACMCLYNEYVNRPPMDKQSIIPIGYEGVREKRGGGTQFSNLYMVIKGEQKIRRVMCRGTVSEIYKKLTMFQMYDVPIGKFKDSTDFIADERSKFDNPRRLNQKPADIMVKLGVKEVTVSNVGTFLSAKDSQSRVDRTDLRCIQGFISRKYIGKRKDGTEFGVYNIIDPGSMTYPDEVESTEPAAAATAQQRTGLSIWCDPSLMAYEERDVCKFYGSTDISKKEPFDPVMNAIFIVPVIVAPKQASGE